LNQDDVVSFSNEDKKSLAHREVSVILKPIGINRTNA